MSLLYVAKYADSSLIQGVELFQKLMPVSEDPATLDGILKEFTDPKKLPDKELELLICSLRRTIDQPFAVSETIEFEIDDKTSKFKRILGRAGFHPKRTIDIDVPINGKHPPNHSKLKNVLAALMRLQEQRKATRKS